jgi:hypothetical protein
MFLTSANLAFHLIARGVITTESVVDGDFIVVEVGRRNRNFKVYRQQWPSLFVKQIRAMDALSLFTLNQEARFYESVHSRPALRAIRDIVPGFVDFDTARRALTISLVPESECLLDRQRREHRLIPEAADWLGTALGRCHAQWTIAALDPPVASSFVGQTPWIMDLELVGFATMKGIGPIGEQLAQQLAGSRALLGALNALRDEWHRDSLIHGDPKWENFLVRDPAGDTSGGANDGGPERSPYFLVDWELVDLGDGAWDVAMVLKEYLVAWILSLPDAHMQAPHPQGAGLPALTLDDIKPLARRFWKSYATVRGLSGAAALTYMMRCTRFTAARLIVALLEYFHTESWIGVHGLAMLQLAAEILRDPRSASSSLLGLEAT